MHLIPLLPHCVSLVPSLLQLRSSGRLWKTVEDCGRLWKMCVLLLVLVGMCSIGFSSAYSNGSVSTVCDTLLPGHDSSPHITTSPYQVTANSTTYGPGDSITVTLSTVQNGTVFQGFMLQARSTGNTAAVGTFSSSDASQFRLLDCSSVTNSTICHANAGPKTQLETIWVASLASSPGNIEFWATFVQNYTHYWTPVKSSIISSASKVISVSSSVMCICVLTVLTVLNRSFH